MKIEIIISYLLFFLPLHISAQEQAVTLSGSVLDQETKEPLPFVNVVLKAAKDSSFCKF